MVRQQSAWSIIAVAFQTLHVEPRNAREPLLDMSAGLDVILVINLWEPKYANVMLLESGLDLHPRAVPMIAAHHEFLAMA
jgi:hypothetical protein